MGAVIKATLAWQQIYSGTIGEAVTLRGSDLYEPRTSCFVMVDDGRAGWKLDVTFEELDPLTKKPLKGGKVKKGQVTPTSPHLLLTIPFGELGEYQVTLKPTFTGGLTSISAVRCAMRSEPVINTMDSDGRQFVVTSKASQNALAQFVGEDDYGTALMIAADAAAEQPQKVDLRFVHVVEVTGGKAEWGEGVWSSADKFNVLAIMPATPATEVGTGGNADKVPVPSGNGLSMFVPAENGAWQVDLATAVPVPKPGQGYWDCDMTKKAGPVTVSNNPGGADYVLLDEEQSNKLVRGARMTPTWHNADGSISTGTFKVPLTEVQEIHPSWKMRLEVTRTTLGTGTISGTLVIHRVQG